jgi:hypothetical protein
MTPITVKAVIQNYRPLFQNDQTEAVIFAAVATVTAQMTTKFNF